MEISPFEFKNKLISLAEGHKKATRTLLNAGRGNPNWVAATPREAFFALGQFAVQESRRTWNERDLAGHPEREGVALRFGAFIRDNQTVPGVQLLKDVVDYGIRHYRFEPDEWVYELVDGIMGDNYPQPDRMLVRIEQLVHDFLIRELGFPPGAGHVFDLFAVEGATAAMSYLFDSLAANYLLLPGDRVAMMVPIFAPYIEIPDLKRYDFEIVELKATAVDQKGKHIWQYPDAEIAKLADPSIKALFLVNPSNPPSVAIEPQSVKRLKQIVTEQNPNLMLISDDVYATFVDQFRSMAVDLPFNTLVIYSFSKYFGVTGWRLGVVALPPDNVFDHLLRQLPSDRAAILRERYSSLSSAPAEIRFIDRMVADSRQVALNHTAGLSTPQQVQMSLFAAFALLDRENTYKRQTKEICHRRIKLLYEGLGLPQPNLPYDADYYTQFDLEEWANFHYGKEFTAYLQKNYTVEDILFRLAENSAIVLLNGGGFHGPAWSVRVSLANLDDAAYAKIGQELRSVLAEYVEEWRSSAARP
ncbi:aminotransferases class-i pyridoxal-phosphate attachment site [Lucifera butyrica]|uniref:Aminotransferase n=1 Tax=Lucifera butyrica TaxID=1351585 RepID=A0A498RDX6_9FIRM|nr:aspartate 4-decarboxylase [Lucifera butyrica]VBB09195.1 aminotransferases class-i pyridoxal-phosphate attachment site [Lucifera butyrica]